MSCIGSPVEFEFSSTDATTAAAITLRNAGERLPRVLDAEDRVILQGFTALTATAAGIIRMIADTDEDGDVDTHDTMALFASSFSGLAHADYAGSTGGGMAGSKGVMPKIIADSAGKVDIVGYGVIVRG